MYNIVRIECKHQVQSHEVQYPMSVVLNAIKNTDVKLRAILGVYPWTYGCAPSTDADIWESPLLCCCFSAVESASRFHQEAREYGGFQCFT